MTRLARPRTREMLVDRPDLIERLSAGRASALTLVSAPAGYGKTTLLAQWTALASETPSAWVVLDESDSDPPVLWGHVVQALSAVHERAGSNSLGAFSAGPRAIAETALPLLVEELSDCPPVVLVLDDWHRVTSPHSDKTLGWFVEHAPATIQIVVSTRSDPRLPIARLRAHGELTELRAKDLRFSPDEASMLFRDAGLSLARRDVKRLTDRVEGWPAGLCLALLALDDQPDPSAYIAEFSGESRHVVEYLKDDVLNAVDSDLRGFMVRTSVLDVLSGQLCDAVLERKGSASVLAEIDHANYFLMAINETGSEYRYHHLFKSVLGRELEATIPDEIPALHARASLWYEEHGDVERTIEHAIASRDLMRSSALVTRAAVPVITSGRMVTLNRWLSLLAWPEAEADRELAVIRALSARVSGQGHDEVERWLAVAERGPDFGPLANGVASIRTGVAMVSAFYLSRGIVDAVESARYILETEPADSPWRYAGLIPLGQALYLAGRLDQARAPLEDARRLAGARQRIATTIGAAYLSLIEVAEGRIERAVRLAQDAVELAFELGHAASPAAANAHLALGCALTHTSDVHRALEHLERAVDLASTGADTYWHAHALLHLASARNRLGDRHGAARALASAYDELDRLPDAGALGVLAQDVDDAIQHRSRREGFFGDDLSDAERRVLELFAHGRSVSEVAHELWLSPNTVKTHRRSIYRKLGVSTRQELLELTRAMGGVDAVGGAHLRDLPIAGK